LTLDFIIISHKIKTVDGIDIKKRFYCIGNFFRENDNYSIASEPISLYILAFIEDTYKYFTKTFSEILKYQKISLPRWVQF